MQGNMRRYIIRRFRTDRVLVLVFVCCVIVVLTRKLGTGSVETYPLDAKLNEFGDIFNLSFEAESKIAHIRQFQTGSWNVSMYKSHVLDSRSLRVNEVCQRIKKTTGHAKEVVGIKSLNFAYCVVPKAGCTVWLRVLQYFAGQGRRADGPMALSKYDIHNRGTTFYKRITLGHSTSSSSLEPFFRAMTVRDPYTRLWSAYVDKLLLPDFWTTKGKMIIKMLRQYPSDKSLRCGHDVTFIEFLTYVLKIGHGQRYIEQDKHWLPASDICDPCTFQPEVIGKQETLMEDFGYTVTRLGIPSILDSVVTKDPVEFEIEDEIDYNFNIYHIHSSCVDTKELCRRMWKAFQYNGYIPPSESFDHYVKSDSITKSDFLSVIRDVRTQFNVTKSDKKRWRKDSMQQAFRAVSTVGIEGVIKLYQLDFAMFGYTSHPDYLY